MNFNINALTLKDHVTLEQARKTAIENYTKAGYVAPTYATTLIAEVYNSIYNKEAAKAIKDGKDGISPTVGEKIEFLRDLTEVKLYNKLTTAFKQGDESFEFGFTRGMPDKQTADFFNLEDVAGAEISTTRTHMVRLPESFHCQKDCVFTMTPQGDNVCIDGQLYGVNPCNVDTAMPPVQE